MRCGGSALGCGGAEAAAGAESTANGGACFDGCARPFALLDQTLVAGIGGGVGVDGLTLGVEGLLPALLLGLSTLKTDTGCVVTAITGQQPVHEKHVADAATMIGLVASRFSRGARFLLLSEQGLDLAQGFIGRAAGGEKRGGWLEITPLSVGIPFSILSVAKGEGEKILRVHMVEAEPRDLHIVFDLAFQ